MLPQEKFAYKYLYEGNFSGLLPHRCSLDKDIEILMSECHLKLKQGKQIKDLREVFWGYGSMMHKNIDSHIEWALARADKVWTIDWNTLKI